MDKSWQVLVRSGDLSILRKSHAISTSCLCLHCPFHLALNLGIFWIVNDSNDCNYYYYYGSLSLFLVCFVLAAKAGHEEIQVSRDWLRLFGKHLDTADPLSFEASNHMVVCRPRRTWNKLWNKSFQASTIQSHYIQSHDTLHTVLKDIEGV